MNQVLGLAIGAAVLASLLGAGHANAASSVSANDAQPRVMKLRRDPAYAFRQEGDRFKRSEPVSSGALALPAKVLQVSPKGYVLVSAFPVPVWLDKLDVEIHPKLSVKARCAPAITSAADTTTALTRGAGEGCK